MTERRPSSKLTIPINPTTLFTTVIGAIIIGFLFYLSDIPGNVADTQNNVESLQKDLESIKTTTEKQWPMMQDYGQRIQRIEDTRFTSEDAVRLGDNIVREVKQVIQPVADNAGRNERDINRLEQELNSLEADINRRLRSPEQPQR